MNETKATKLISHLPKLGNYAIGVTAILYLFGFAITNLQLASLGVINTSLFKARYIVAGLMFALFLGAVSFLVCSLRRTLRGLQGQSAWIVLRGVVTHSLLNIVVVTIALLAVTTLAGYADWPHIPSQSTSPIPSIDWATWVSRTPTVTKRAGTLFVYVLLALVSMFLAIVMISPTDQEGNRRSRLGIILGLIQEFFDNWRRVVGQLFGLFCFILIFYIIQDLLAFVFSDDLQPTPSLQLRTVWFRLWFTIVMIYLLLGTLFTFSQIFTPPTAGTSSDKSTTNLSSRITIVSGTVLMLVPLYTSAIYPYLPQQVGGGKLAQVEVTISKNELNSIFHENDTEIFLVDRGPDVTIFLLSNSTTDRTRVIEVSNTLVEAVIFSDSNSSYRE